MKTLKYIFVSLFSFFIFNINLLAATIVVENDLESSYVPTTIINGSFTSEPWMSYKFGGIVYDYCEHTAILRDSDEVYFNGVDAGWNTTETYVWNGNLFEYSSDNLGVHNITYNPMMPPTDRYVEMNGTHSALLYQDLSTYSNDVILWKLKHGVTISVHADAIQPMRVEIGAPNMNGEKIVDAHGMNSDIDSEIVLSTKAVYRSTGVTDSEGKISTLGFAGSDISNLSLSKTANSNGWYTASGIYIIPEGQNVTRFGFIAEGNTPSFGNLLDDIEFSTLIGNLNAVYNDDKSATVTGYWGEVNPAKKLVIKIGENTYELDMSSVDGNFKFDISKDIIGKATYIEVYHEDYSQVKKEVKIVAGKVTKKVSGNTENIKITSDDETIINSLDEESVNKIKHGEDVAISLEINNITDTIEKDEKDLFVSNLKGYKLGEIYEVSLYKKLESDEEDIKVSELNKKIEFSIELPKELISDNRTYKILNYYDDKFEVIDARYDKNTKSLIFETDKIFKMAIIYQDNGTPNTGDNTGIYIFSSVISIFGIISAFIYVNKKEI